MIFLVCLGLLVAISIVPALYRHNSHRLGVISQMLLLGLVGYGIAYTLLHHEIVTVYMHLFQFNGISLVIALQFDALAKVMTIFILVIGFFIYRYAQNYLESDRTRARFLSQLSLVLFSVVLLVMANNILTAFIAWQFIGLNLYLLLNHYHHDPAANRAAKKKFVINRIGDCSFLLAMIIAYATHSAHSFTSIQLSAHAELICLLLFISVMSKCAQFPFHIWLIDTMETPTPVSALMHAGVINAGGILLTRVSATLTQFHTLNYFILFVGLLSALLSIYWMAQQPDTKKKLAYSTMGQMGYMLAQCSLGAFPAAVFHLISHGFYKASLFLNNGESFYDVPKREHHVYKHREILAAMVVSTVIFILGISLFKSELTNMPWLIYGFMYLTLTTMVLQSNRQMRESGLQIAMSYLIIMSIFFVYLYLFHALSQLLGHYDYHGAISTQVQWAIIAITAVVQYCLWRRNSADVFLVLTDKTERAWRYIWLTPLRAIGDVTNKPRYSVVMSSVYVLVMVLSIVGFFFGLYRHAVFPVGRLGIDAPAVLLFLVVGILALIFANRCKSIKALIVYIALFELAFINVAFFDGNSNILKIGVFHLITMASVILMLMMLAKKPGLSQIKQSTINRLPTRIFYLVFALLLIIGIPGTASFVSEFYLLAALIHSNVVFISLYIGLIILTAIVVMHSLQLYAFGDKQSPLLLLPVDKLHHWIFGVIIAVNILFGLWPNSILNYL